MTLPRGSKTPITPPAYINEIFGTRMNGIRERAWLRLISGHLNIETFFSLAQSRAKVGERETKVNMFEIKVTPSVKNLVYSVYLVFSSGGGV